MCSSLFVPKFALWHACLIVCSSVCVIECECMCWCWVLSIVGVSLLVVNYVFVVTDDFVPLLIVNCGWCGLVVVCACWLLLLLLS